MAEKYPLATGNWSNAANWNGGTKPAVGDDVYSNNFIVTIDESVSVNSLRGTAGAVAVAGGQFTTSGSVTVAVSDGSYGGTGQGFLLINSGATFNGTAKENTSVARDNVRVFAGAVMNGNAQGRNAVVVNGGVMNGDARHDLSTLGGTCAGVLNGGIINGNSISGAITGQGIFATLGGEHRGNSQGGSGASAYGTHCQNGGIHRGNSNAGTVNIAPGTELRSGGVQIGNATGGGTNGASGTNCQSGALFFGNATGGTISGSHGLSISGGFAQVGTATGTTAGAFGVSAINFCEVIIGAESGDYAKSLGADVTTDNSRYPFEGTTGGPSRPVNPFTQQVIG